MKKTLLILFFIFSLFATNLVFGQEDSDVSINQDVLKIDVNKLQYSQKQLVYAILTGNNQAVETILASDENPKKTYNGIPLVLFAIYADKLEILQTLIKYEFDPNQVFMDVTPLELAVSLKRYEITKYLLSIGIIPTKDCYVLAKKSKDKKIKELFE